MSTAVPVLRSNVLDSFSTLVGRDLTDTFPVSESAHTLPVMFYYFLNTSTYGPKIYKKINERTSNQTKKQTNKVNRNSSPDDVER